MNKVNYNTIIRFFKNECSEEERLLIIKWVNESQEHAEQFFRWEELYHLGNNSEKGNDLAIRKAEKKLYERIEIEKSHQWFFSTINRWVKYAAVITSILAISGLTLWYFVADSQEKWITASTTNGETLEITLPDNSKVWLNENSILKYPEHFTKEKRELHLTGEAYFEVTKNKHKPFTVQSSAMNVQVLGTKFNFKTPSNGRIVETSLIEGEIKVSGNNNEGAITLSPGQKVELNTVTKQMKVSETNAAALDAIWHNNLIPFKNADIFDIAEVLEKVYGVKIILSPDISPSTTYSGVLKRKDSIEDVLRILQNTIHLQYKIHQETIFISSASK